METGATARPMAATKVTGMLTRPKRPGRVSMAPEHPAERLAAAEKRRAERAARRQKEKTLSGGKP